LKDVLVNNDELVLGVGAAECPSRSSATVDEAVEDF